MNFFQKLFGKKESKPDFQKPQYVDKGFAPTTYTNPAHKKISLDAKIEAKVLNLPTTIQMSASAKIDPNWIRAFVWYNKHLHIGARELGMGCRPCWNKVYFALKKVKEME